MAKPTITKLLAKIEKDLMRAAGFLESRGFDGPMVRLDAAADHVQEVRESLEALRDAVAQTPRQSQYA